MIRVVDRAAGFLGPPYPAVVVFPEGATAAGALVGLPDSDCEVGVGIGRYPSYPVDRGLALEIHHLPAGTFGFRPFGRIGLSALSAPGGVVVLEAE